MKCATSWWWVVNIGVLCIPRMTAASGSALAGGSITFAGAVVEPTCSVSTASIDAVASMHASHAAMRSRFACGHAEMTSGSSRFYSVTVVNLDAALINHDRVLEYFAGYVKAEGGNETAAKLVTQTFE